MSELLGSIVGGGGAFASRAANADIISAGVTGTILTLTPPDGQRVKLTHLSTDVAVEQSGISVVFGTTTVVSEKILAGGQPRGPLRFSVGTFQAYAAGAPPNGNYPAMTGKINEVLTITKNAGNTAQDIYYGYEYGE